MTNNLNLPVEFEHKIVNRLFEIDSFIETETLEEILLLGDKVVPDLEAILRYAINDPDYFIDTEWAWAHLHAFYLLAEMESIRSLPLILEFLEQDAGEFLDYLLGDMVGEASWQWVCTCGRDSIHLLEQFLLRPKIDWYPKSAVARGLGQIAVFWPEQKDDVATVFSHCFFKYSRGALGIHAPGQNVFDTIEDPEALSWIMCAAIDSRDERHHPEIRKAIRQGLTDPGVFGEGALSRPPFESQLRNIFENYDYINTHYHSASLSPHNPNPPKPVKKVQPTEPYVPWTPPPTRVSRNAPCPCGSGKKYKKCCLGK